MFWESRLLFRVLFPFIPVFFSMAQLDTMVEEIPSRVARLQSEFSVLHTFLFPENHPRPQNLHELKQFSAKHSDQLIKLSNLHRTLIRLKYPNMPISAPKTPPLHPILTTPNTPLQPIPPPTLPQQTFKQSTSSSFLPSLLSSTTLHVTTLPYPTFTSSF